MKIRSMPTEPIDGLYRPNLLVDGFYRPNLLIDSFYRPNLLIDGFHRPMLLIHGFYQPNLLIDGLYRPILSTACDFAHRPIVTDSGTDNELFLDTHVNLHVLSNYLRIHYDWYLLQVVTLWHSGNLCLVN